MSFISVASGELKKDKAIKKLRGPVRTVISRFCGEQPPPFDEPIEMFTYDKQGNEIKQGESWIWKREYDPKSRLRKKILTRPDGHSSQIEEFTYEPEGQVTVEEKIYIPSIPPIHGGIDLGPDQFSMVTYIYDERGRLLEKRPHIPEVGMDLTGTMHSRYTYYENGDKHEFIQFKPDGLLYMKNVYKYEEIPNGKRVEDTLYNANLESIRKNRYEYDRYGNRTLFLSLEALYGNQTVMETTTYQYEYDTEGNWTKQMRYADLASKELVSEICRKIVYY